MASYSPPTPPLPPHVTPPPSPPPPPFPLHDTTLTLSLEAPQQPPPLAWAFPSPPPCAPKRRPRPLSTLAPLRLRAPASASSGDTPPPSYPCTLCGRPFPSQKALFGHMRCHPERPYRGMTPPRFLGRHEAAGGAPPLVAAADGFTEPADREVADILLTLADGPRHKGKGKKRLRLLGSPCCWKETGGASATERNDDDHHKCGVCHRGFATGQALGGHKRCHMEKATTDDQAVVLPATSRSRVVLAAAPEEETSTSTALDLNLPPPVSPRKDDDDQGGRVNAAALDLKLGY